MKRPVFVDHTGRRRRAAIVLGSGLAVLLILGLIMLTAGLVTGSPVPLPGWPDAQKGDVPAATPGPEVAPGPTSRTPGPKATTTDPSQPAVTTTGPGNGNGNGSGHGRPTMTKSPGKP